MRKGPCGHPQRAQDRPIMRARAGSRGQVQGSRGFQVPAVPPMLERRDVPQDKQGFGAGDQAEPAWNNHGKMPGVQFRNGFLQVRGIGCRAGGVPAMRHGCHDAEGLRRVLSGGLDRQTGGIDTCICRNRMEYWSSHASGLPDSPRGAGYVSDGDSFELDCQAALQPAGTAAARSPWSSHLVATGHESCGLAP